MGVERDAPAAASSSATLERDGGTALDDSGSCRGRHAGREEDLDEPYADVVLAALWRDIGLG